MLQRTGGTFLHPVARGWSSGLEGRVEGIEDVAGMKLQLLGGFVLTEPTGRSVPITLRRGQALLAYLALKGTRSESREALADLLWPDRFKEQAQASLRQVLFELRGAA